MEAKKCLFCTAPLRITFVDLGMHPLCESYVSEDKLNNMEPFYPLHVFICEHCLLVQLHEYGAQQTSLRICLFSSYADSWVKHAKQYTEIIVERLKLTEKNLSSTR